LQIQLLGLGGLLATRSSVASRAVTCPSMVALVALRGVLKIPWPAALPGQPNDARLATAPPVLQ